MKPEDYASIEQFVDENQEMLVRVLRHSDSSFARTCALVVLDRADTDFSADGYLQEVREEEPEAAASFR